MRNRVKSMKANSIKSIALGMAATAFTDFSGQSSGIPNSINFASTRSQRIKLKRIAKRRK